MTDNLAATLAAHDREVAELREKVRRYEARDAEVADLSSKCNALVAANSDLQAKLVAANGRVSQLSSDLTKANAENQSARLLTVAHSDLQRRFTGAEAKVAQLHTDLMNANGQLVSLRVENGSLKSEIQHLQTRSADQATVLRKQAYYDEQISLLSGQLANANRTLASEREDRSIETEGLKAQLQVALDRAVT